MKRALPLLIAVFVCAPLAADQSLFRNAMIGFGGGSVADVKAADVNHDGKPDAILLQVFGANGASSLITLFGNGDGTFRAPVKTPITTAASIAVADLDGDGNVDVVLNGDYHELDTYRGNSDGSFTLRSSSSAANIGARTPLILTDLNGDGKLDLVAAATVAGSFETQRFVSSTQCAIIKAGKRARQKPLNWSGKTGPLRLESTKIPLRSERFWTKMACNHHRRDSKNCSCTFVICVSERTRMMRSLSKDWSKN